MDRIAQAAQRSGLEQGRAQHHAGNAGDRAEAAGAGLEPHARGATRRPVHGHAEEQAAQHGAHGEKGRKGRLCPAERKHRRHGDHLHGDRQSQGLDLGEIALGDDKAEAGIETKGPALGYVTVRRPDDQTTQYHCIHVSSSRRAGAPITLGPSGGLHSCGCMYKLKALQKATIQLFY